MAFFCVSVNVNRHAVGHKLAIYTYYWVEMSDFSVKHFLVCGLFCM